MSYLEIGRLIYESQSVDAVLTGFTEWMKPQIAKPYSTMQSGDDRLEVAEAYFGSRPQYRDLHDTYLTQLRLFGEMTSDGNATSEVANERLEVIHRLKSELARVFEGVSYDGIPTAFLTKPS